MTTVLLKLRLIEQLGGACQRCGYNRCIRALHFHHLDPGTREFRRHQGSILRAVERDPSGFELLCSNCHIEEHDSQDSARRVQRTCVTCERVFSVKPYVVTIGRGLYCSRACKGASLKLNPPRAGTGAGLSAVSCLHCNRDFTTPTYRVNTGRGRYCSRQCLHAALRRPRKSMPLL